MNPSHSDPDYQESLARRGAFLEYDMIGMDYYYADQDAQSPATRKTPGQSRRLWNAASRTVSSCRRMSS